MQMLAGSGRAKARPIPMSEQDEALLIAGHKDFRVEVLVTRKFGPFVWTRKETHTIRIQPWPLMRLMFVNRVIEQLGKNITDPVEMFVATCSAIIGPIAYAMTEAQLIEIWDAYREFNLIPKADAAATAAPPTTPSPDGSNGGPSTSTEPPS